MKADNFPTANSGFAGKQALEIKQKEILAIAGCDYPLSELYELCAIDNLYNHDEVLLAGGGKLFGSHDTEDLLSKREYILSNDP